MRWASARSRHDGSLHGTMLFIMNRVVYYESNRVVAIFKAEEIFNIRYENIDDDRH